ncbi:MAG TPA: DUF488 domain-containing protein [Candidatus Saccharimonadales bacterium]|nr:DUF488 domain-containing protein [Candidatus Saccharimonadales bacterium]
MYIKRIYDQAEPQDGYRILVDRLWPRGVSKEKAHVDVWLKEIGPSSDLRTWFGHQPERFKDFRTKYEKELNHNPTLDELKSIIKKHPSSTLLYSARDTTMNQAVVLLEILKNNKK